MSLPITELAHRLQVLTEWQKTPIELSEFDYEQMVINGIRRLFIDTGRASSYNADLIIRDEQDDATYDGDFLIDEEEYILLVAQIGFYQRVANDVNNIVGYTTDALTVTNADKPYANLADTITKLERERRILYYKMVRYTML